MFDTNRIAVGDQLTARFQGQSYGGRLEAGYRYAVAPMVGVIPYAAVQVQTDVAATLTRAASLIMN